MPNLECLKFPKVRGKAWPLATLGVVAVARVSFARSVCLGMNCEPVRRMQTSVYLLCQKRAYTVGVSLEEHMHTGKENNGGPFPPWSSGAPNAIQETKRTSFLLGRRFGHFHFVLLAFYFLFAFSCSGGCTWGQWGWACKEGPPRRFRLSFFLCFFVSLLRSGWLWWGCLSPGAELGKLDDC